MNRAYSILSVKAVDDDRRVISGMATTPAVDRVGDVGRTDAHAEQAEAGGHVELAVDLLESELGLEDGVVDRGGDVGDGRQVGHARQPIDGSGGPR